MFLEAWLTEQKKAKHDFLLRNRSLKELLKNSFWKVLIWKLIWYTKSALSKESMLSSESIVESKIKRSEAQERLLVLPIVTRVGVVY